MAVVFRTVGFGLGFTAAAFVGTGALVALVALVSCTAGEVLVDAVSTELPAEQPARASPASSPTTVILTELSVIHRT